MKQSTDFTRKLNNLGLLIMHAPDLKSFRIMRDNVTLHTFMCTVVDLTDEEKTGIIEGYAKIAKTMQKLHN